MTHVAEDALPHPDGLETVLFADGHTEYGGVYQGNPNPRCLDNMREVGLGLSQYVEDYDERYPPMDTPGNFRTALQPYVPGRKTFICPATNTWYQPNKCLEGQSIAGVQVPASTNTVSDELPHWDGYKTICYADGHVVHGTVQLRVGSNDPCKINLADIGAMLNEYLEDHGGYFPPTDTLAHLKAALAPYADGAGVQYSCPDTGVPYVINTAISGKDSENIAYNEQWILADTQPHVNGVSNTLSSDGEFVAPTYSFEPSVLSIDLSNSTDILSTSINNQAAVLSLSGSGEEIGATQLLPYDSHNYATGIGYMVGPDSPLSLTWSGDLPQVWTLSPQLAVENVVSYPPYPGWRLAGIGAGPNYTPREFWTQYDNNVDVWSTDSAYQYVSDMSIPAQPGKKPVGFAVGQDNLARVLWAGTDHTAVVTTVKANGSIATATYGPNGISTAIGLTVDPDNNTRILWENSDGSASLWQVTSTGVTRTTNIAAAPGYTPLFAGVGADGLVRVLFKSITGSTRIYLVHNNGDLVSVLDYPAITELPSN